MLLKTLSCLFSKSCSLAWIFLPESFSLSSSAHLWLHKTCLYFVLLSSNQVWTKPVVSALTGKTATVPEAVWGAKSGFLTPSCIEKKWNTFHRKTVWIKAYSVNVWEDIFLVCLDEYVCANKTVLNNFVWFNLFNWSCLWFPFQGGPSNNFSGTDVFQVE